jgi:hypothetical protein
MAALSSVGNSSWRFRKFVGMGPGPRVRQTGRNFLFRSNTASSIQSSVGNAVVLSGSRANEVTL